MYHNDTNNDATTLNTTKESSMIDLNSILNAALNNAITAATAPLLERIEALEQHIRRQLLLPTPAPTISEANIEAMVERKIHDAVENLDIDNMVENAVENLDVERMVEDAVDNIDFNEKVDIDDLAEALKSNTDWASMIENVISSGSFSTTFTR